MAKTKKSKHGKIKKTTWRHYQNDFIAIDIKVPIKTKFFKWNTKEKQFYLVVMIGVFTRFTEISIVWNISIEEIKHSWKHRLKEIENQRKYISDRGRQFISKKFEETYRNLEMKHLMTPCYASTSNSVVEKSNEQIGEVFRIMKGRIFNQPL